MTCAPEPIAGARRSWQASSPANDALRPAHDAYSAVHAAYTDVIAGEGRSCQATRGDNDAASLTNACDRVANEQARGAKAMTNNATKDAPATTDH